MTRLSSFKATLAIFIALVCLISCADPKAPIHVDEVSIEYSSETGEVTMTTPTSGAVIYYTLNRTYPGTSSNRYDGPFVINESSNIMAVAYKDGVFSSVTYLDVEYENPDFEEEPVETKPAIKLDISYDEESKSVSIATNRDDCKIYYGFKSWEIKNEYTGSFVPPAGVTVYAKSVDGDEEPNVFSLKVPMWAEVICSYDYDNGLLSLECTDPRLDIRYAIDTSIMIESSNESGPSFTEFNLHLYSNGSDIYSEPLEFGIENGLLFDLNYDGGEWLLDEHALYTIPIEADLEIVYAEDGYFEIVDHNEDTRDSENVHIYYTLSGDNPIEENANNWWNIRYYEKGSRILVGPGVEIKAAARTYNSISEVETLETEGPYVIGGKGELGIIFYDVDADNDSGNEDGLTSSECGYRYFEATLGDVRVYENESGCGFTSDLYSAIYRFDCMADPDSDSPADYAIAYEYFRAPDYFCFANGTEENNDSIVGTRKDFGAGKENTALMLSHVANGGEYYSDERGRAFEYGVVSALKSFDESEGWFIPSYEETKVMHDTFVDLGVGNIYTSVYAEDPENPDVLTTVYYNYWTSSEFFDTDDYSYTVVGGTYGLDNHSLVHTYPDYDEKFYNVRRNPNMLKLVRTF